MAFTEMSATGKNTIRPCYKAAHNKGRIDPPGAHHPNGAKVRWILIALDSGSIRSGVTTPVTKKPKDSGRKFLLTHMHLYVAAMAMLFLNADCQLKGY